jgi:PHD/YefM family antitoxin component YafN of YafNO toxin-antitoxin module
MAIQRITAGEFQKKIGFYQDQAQRAPIAVTKHDRDYVVVISAAEWQRLSQIDRRAVRFTDEPELLNMMIEGLQSAKVPDEDAKMLDPLCD